MAIRIVYCPDQVIQGLRHILGKAKIKQHGIKKLTIRLQIPVFPQKGFPNLPRQPGGLPLIFLLMQNPGDSRE
ncbi:hypothetical protein D3C80_2166820 [compost metagenome]